MASGDGWDLHLRTIDIQPRYCNETNDGVPVYRGRDIVPYGVTQYPKLWADEKYVKRQEGDAWGHHRLGIRVLTSPTNTRSLIAGILPPFTTSNTSLLASMAPAGWHDIAVLGALLNSTACDWEFRRTCNTTAAAYHIEQLHVPWLDPESELYRELGAAVTALRNIRYRGLGALREGRMTTRADALAAHAYKLSRHEYEHILESFPLVPPESRWACVMQYDRLEERPG